MNWQQHEWQELSDDDLAFYTDGYQSVPVFGERSTKGALQIRVRSLKVYSPRYFSVRIVEFRKFANSKYPFLCYPIGPFHSRAFQAWKLCTVTYHSINRSKRPCFTCSRNFYFYFSHILNDTRVYMDICDINSQIFPINLHKTPFERYDWMTSNINKGF